MLGGAHNTKREAMKKCILCKGDLVGDGHSACPLRRSWHGRCCDDCVTSRVLPARRAEVAECVARASFKVYYDGSRCATVAVYFEEAADGCEDSSFVSSLHEHFWDDLNDDVLPSDNGLVIYAQGCEHPVFVAEDPTLLDPVVNAFPDEDGAVASCTGRTFFAFPHPAGVCYDVLTQRWIPCAWRLELGV